MNALVRLAAATALVCALAGCAEVIDAGQARTCRSVIPALNPADASIEIMRTMPLGGDGVRIDYRARAADGPSRDRFIACQFGGSSLASAERGSLVGVVTEAGPLSELRLQLLKRFWLATEGTAADPEPISGATRVPMLPRPMAVALQHVLLALPSISIYALLAAAYSLMYGLVGRINLAFGELAAVSGYAAFLGVALAGPGGGIALPLLLALLLALVAALCWGIASGRFVFQPLAAQTGQRVLIGTIALAIVLQEFLRLTQGSRLKWVQPMLGTPYAVARAGDFVVTVTPMAVGAAALCLLAAGALLGLMRASRFGRSWRACADDPGAAELFGVDRRRVLLETFALGSVLAGLAGYVMTVYYGTLGYAGGFVLGIKALLAAVVGGIGSVPGAFLGGLLLGGAEALWSALFPIEFRDLAIFALLVALLVLRPSGLFGFAELLPKRP
jgi:branched-subunit amino acid ABC-type transport system permease component